ncbi:MAG: hypothetical protein CMJ18_08085 [Phycisphaeraceae bacterium]|nr:hypothetical protein [Phycisphaeraceae bacterium]
MIARINIVVVTAVVAMFVAGTAHADTLVNIDATTVTPNNFTTAESGGDNLWRVRDETGNGFLGDDIIEAHETEDAPELTMTVDVTADLEGPGLYDVFLRFVMPASFGQDNHGAAGAIGSDPLIEFVGGPSGGATQIAPFGPWNAYEGDLGTVFSSSTISVRMDHSGPQRNWLESVRFSLIPEPTTLGLTAVGALLMLRRRR